MKRIIFSTFFLLFSIASFAQNITYNLKTDIAYYTDSLSLNPYTAKQCVLDIYYPTNSKNYSTVIWFHGGGLSGGRKEIPQELKDKGICVIGVGYRLDPYVKSPEYIKDAAAAIAWTFNHIAEYGGDRSKIFVSGHSAGAYLSTMVSLDKKWLGNHQIDANEIAGLISLSAQAITHFTIRKERGLAETKVVVDEFAPLYFVRNDAPPTLLITGDRELEMLGRYEENAYLMRMLKIVGHKDVRLLEIQGYGHGMTKPAFPLLLEEVKRRSK